MSCGPIHPSTSASTSETTIRISASSAPRSAGSPASPSRTRSPALSPSIGNTSATISERHGSEEARDDVDAEGEDGGVEHEREHAVDESQPAYPSRGDLHVGYLTGHPDHEREVAEVHEVRLRLARKQHPAVVLRAHVLVALAVVDVRVVQGEDRVHEAPGGHHGANGQHHVPGQSPGLQTLGGAEEVGDGKEARAGADD